MTPEAIWLFELRQKYDQDVAFGAYTVLMGREVSGISNPKLIVGMIEGFLYTREVDWTATAHQEVLNRLKNQYEGNISHQDARFREIEQQNKKLNESFQTTLSEKTLTLDNLHGDQTEKFEQIINEHETKLKIIEQIYDQKLALQKPVEYWQTKETFHRDWSRCFGITSIIAGAIVAIFLGSLVHWIFGHMSPDQNPKHWQIGILAIAAFFSVWIIRILVRLFLSHLHLATDTAERRTMILTYLSMAREGSQFNPQDKSLILQHLFRSTSDGLVKDDAAPPNVFEFLTRK